MTQSSSFKSLTLAASLAVMGAAGFGVATGHAGAFSAANVVRPLAGLSFPVGSKHAVGYFLSERGGCDLTLLVGESGDQVSEMPRGSAATRFNTFVSAGRTARIDTADGPSVEFFCSTGSNWLTTRVIDRVAYSAPAR
jgi:hypothetical protein